MTKTKISLLHRIEIVQQKISKKIANNKITLSELEDKTKLLDMSEEDFAMLKELVRLSLVEKEITSEDAIVIFDYTHSLDEFNKQSFAVKSVITMKFVKLCERINGKPKERENYCNHKPR